MKLGTLVVKGSKFRLPCVYEFVHDGVVLYVGRSDAGFVRVFRGYAASKRYSTKSGPVPRGPDKRAQAFDDCDEIRVTVFDSTGETRAEEIRLIRLHKPAANTYHNKAKG